VAVDLVHGNHVYDGLSSTGCNVISAWCAPASVTAPHEVPPCLGFGAASAARAARAPRVQAGTSPQQLWIPAGTAVENLLLSSAEGLPQVQISGPSGSYTTAAGPQTAGQQPTFVSGGDADQHQVVLTLLHPRAGAYTITPVPGTPPLEPVLEDHPLPDPGIRVHVSAHANKWTLHFADRPEPGQQIQFFERAKDVDTPIGKPVKVAQGTIRFTPQSGSANRRRQIVAELFERGMPQQPRVVGSYLAPPAPKLGRPGRVKFSRARNVVTLRWPAALNAKGYQVLVTASDGRRVLYVTSAVRRSLRLAPIYPDLTLHIALSATGGPRNEPGASRLLTLPRLPAAKKRH
jgi:hypothetical protein